MAQAKKSARVIVFGNAKGGSGKSTCALHAAVALLQAGHSVATIDLDNPQRTFTRAIDNRNAWNSKTGRALVMPDHTLIESSESDSLHERQQQELSAFADVVGQVEHTHDFVIIDTPGFDTPLMRLVHGLADTVVTPINDSFVDLDLLVQPENGETDPTRPGPYARLVEKARRQRKALDGGTIDWIVVLNRLSMIQSNNKIKVRDAVSELAGDLGFRLARGVSERVIFREFFPLGVTAFDPLDAETFGVRPSMSHVSARNEMRRLVETIGLADYARSRAAPKPAKPKAPARKRKPAPRKKAPVAAMVERPSVPGVTGTAAE